MEPVLQPDNELGRIDLVQLTAAYPYRALRHAFQTDSYLDRRENFPASADDVESPKLAMPTGDRLSTVSVTEHRELPEPPAAGSRQMPSRGLPS